MARTPSLSQAPGRRIAVVGTTGSGKTTMAHRLARRLGCPHVELDALHWGPDWTTVPLETFRSRSVQALSGQTWTVDGNYSKVRDIVLGRADTLVWLDYPLPLILWRLIRRTLVRLVTREELWSGNREEWRSQLGPDSLLLWALRTYRRRRREYTAIQGDSRYSHLTFVRLRSPRAAEAWLAAVKNQSPSQSQQARA
jgi:adenylate kinase family enzyme